jgi:glyoxylase-like metal-dependent hydrolase (beta-lactamase superfamily II)
VRVRHLNCGTMAPLSRKLVNGTGSLLVPARIICHCLLIESDDGLVLVDTGIGLHDIANPKEILGSWFLRAVRPRLDRDETAAHQVVHLGYSVQDVRHIVLTHLDVDHAGGIADFPHAHVHVSAAELNSARHPSTALERRRYRQAQWAHEPNWVEHSAEGERWFGFEAVRALPGLAPEVLLVPLGGHTRGHVGVAVDTGHTDRPQWLLHAGDAYFFHGQLQAEPHCPPALRAFQVLMQTDKTTRLHNVRRLRSLAASGEVEIISAHDPVELERALG